MKKINVLYLITTLRPYGGAEVALANLIPYLDASTHNIWVGTVFAQEEEEVKIQLPSDQIRYFKFSKRYYTDIYGYKRLVDFLRINRIDVIHTHLFAANTVGRIAGKFAGVPVIISTEHNTYVNRSPLCVMIDKILARITSKIVAVSNSVLDFSAKQTAINKSIYEYIPNCVPLDKISPMSTDAQVEKKLQFGLNPETQIVLSVGRLTEQKGFPYLFRAAQEVIQSCPNTAFLVVGKGELKEDFEQQIKSLGLEKSVRLLGFRNDIFDLMQISTIFAMPSLWEGLPVTLIEAGACRLPVVATNVGGIMEVVQDGENGLIIPMKDEKALARCLISLLSSPELLRQMAEKARLRVEQSFSGPAVARRVENLYSQCFSSQSVAMNRS
ncbi:MAG: glycosyltransferase family 1 protein [Negativicutes bacterium]|nr:glycosyltransferase family 1 protein [Negativicutes bacterium]